MINPAYKSTRKRRNVKDIFGIGGVLGDHSKNVAIEMSKLFNFSNGLIQD